MMQTLAVYFTRHIICLILLLSVALPNSVYAKANFSLPNAVSTQAQLSPMGQGELRRFGLRVFHAKLWQSPQTKTVYALQLQYALNIKADKIVDASIKEMRQQGVSEQQLKKWQQQLVQVIPDVKKGDMITGVKLNSKTEFYHNNRLVGQVNNPKFADDFFAIWLSPATSEPKLRRQLLKLNK